MAKKKKTGSILKVFIDSKEQDFVTQSQMFFNNKKIHNEVKSLDDGDLKILLSTKDFFVVERKRYDDFASSYIKKHLQDQAIRMNENCKYYCVIIHGDMGDIRRASFYNPSLKKITQKSVDSMYHKMEMIYKCPCFFVENDVQYFNKVIEIANMLVKADGFSRIVKSNITIEEHPDLSILMAGNGIGEKMAQKLIDEFGTPKNVIYASREDLLDVNGVGESTVVKIKKLKEVFENGDKKTV